MPAAPDIIAPPRMIQVQDISYSIGGRAIFDATAPLLPGFVSPPAFAF